MAHYLLWLLAIYGAATLLALLLRQLDRHTPTSVSLILVVKECEDAVEGIVRQIFGVMQKSKEIFSDFYVIDASGGQQVTDILIRLMRQYPQLKLINSGDGSTQEHDTVAQALSNASGEVVWVLKLESGHEVQHVMSHLYVLTHAHLPNGTHGPNAGIAN